MDYVIHWRKPRHLWHLDQSLFWTFFWIAFLAWHQTWDNAPCCEWPECTGQCCCSAGHCWRPGRLSLTQSEVSPALLSSWALQKTPCAWSWLGTNYRYVFLMNGYGIVFAPEGLHVLHLPGTGNGTQNFPSPFHPQHPPLVLHTFLEQCSCLKPYGFLHGYRCRSVLAGGVLRGNMADEPSSTTSFFCHSPFAPPLPRH